VRAAFLSLAASTALLVGCGAAPHTRAAGAVTPLSVRAVPWNPSQAQVGRVSAVADSGSIVAVFGDSGATVLGSGAVVAVDPSVKEWAGASTIVGADGSSRWIVGIDRRGRLHYLRGSSAFDDVSARYGLDGRAFRGASMLDAGRVAFLVDGGIAVADGRSVARYDALPPLLDIAGGGGHGAAIGAGLLVAFDPTLQATRRYAIPGVAAVAVGGDGRIYAATRRALYAAKPDGELALVYDADGDTLHGLAASGAHVWFADGPELGVVEDDHVAETSGAHVPVDARLSPSSTGDVWVLSNGKLDRYARAEAEPALATAWTTTLAPIFARVCSACHQPNGSSGTDLSTAQAWESERAAIRERVVLGRTMPPQGHPLSDADREAIRAWAGER
jgi:hypothetical protein